MRKPVLFHPFVNFGKSTTKRIYHLLVLFQGQMVDFFAIHLDDLYKMKFQGHQLRFGLSLLNVTHHSVPRLLIINEIKLFHQIDESLDKISVGSGIFDTLWFCHVLEIMQNMIK